MPHQFCIVDNSKLYLGWLSSFWEGGIPKKICQITPSGPSIFSYAKLACTTVFAPADFLRTWTHQMNSGTKYIARYSTGETYWGRGLSQNTTCASMSSEPKLDKRVGVWWRHKRRMMLIKLTSWLSALRWKYRIQLSMRELWWSACMRDRRWSFCAATKNPWGMASCQEIRAVQKRAAQQEVVQQSTVRVWFSIFPSTIESWYRSPFEPDRYFW